MVFVLPRSRSSELSLGAASCSAGVAVGSELIRRLGKRQTTCACAPAAVLFPSMNFDLIQIREMAKNKEDENWRFRQFVKNRGDRDPDEIDNLVFETTRRVWAGIDCTTCANCCRQVHPTFNEVDVDRLAQRLEMKRRSSSRSFFSPPKIAMVIRGKRIRFLVLFWWITAAVFMRIVPPIAEDTRISTSQTLCPHDGHDRPHVHVPYCV
jgi:hypothetical protein